MADSGADGLTLHQTMNVIETKKILSGRCSIVGNLDPRSIVQLEPKDIRALSTHCLEEGIDVLAPACGLDPATPVRNLKAIAEATHRFKR
jgi:[methyl-Co(III) methanol-specific corrinoid protein]:coenzyme M methyltransferase